jgi:hypothetical protein
MSIYSKPTNFWRFFFMILDTLKMSQIVGWGEREWLNVEQLRGTKNLTY